MPENQGCYLLIERPTRLVWTGALGEDFRPNPTPQLGFSFVCDLRFTPLAQGGTRFHAIVKHADAEGKTKHEDNLPELEGQKVIGVISVGDLVKNIIEQQGNQIKFLETYIKGHGV